MINHRPIEILLVEDSPSDVRLTQEALSEGQVLNRLHVVNDGVEAIEFLRRSGTHQNASRPDIILLDLNLPRKNGIEVLQEIKQDDDLKSIPVIVLTTSDNEQDVLRSYCLHANAYLTKPVGLDQFMDVIRSFKNFWLTIVTLPPSIAGDEPQPE